ncbi:MAG: FAD-dependent oxidoreductase [Lachnospiraceae bacterium]|nr:FAD-dependent oxidoreductase [Lachnospiraceae bacterium]
MNEMQVSVAVVGGGPAGLAAAVSAKKNGADSVLVIERDNRLGGILKQCIHPGFGLNYFQKELTGPEYAGAFREEAEKEGVEALLNAMVLSVDAEKHEITLVSPECGMTRVRAKSIVLAMGCRERTRAGIQIPGSRPAGIYTAGAAQRLVNLENALVGKKVVILGSGDIGMIMARRMTLEGCEVKAVVEIMDYLAGLTRNRVQCLDDFQIPLLLSHTVTRIVGNERVEGVYVAAVGEDRKPVPGTEEFIACDTLLLSVGLIPENELTREAGIEIAPVTNGPVVDQHMQTSAPGVFASGNVVHVNDLVDNVTVESQTAGKYAALYARGALPACERTVPAVPGTNVRYVCPQILHIGPEEETVRLCFRVAAPKKDVVLTAVSGGKEIARRRERRVNPGEMCHLDLKTRAVEGDSVVISLVSQ